MKKLFLVIAVATFFVACNGSSSTDATTDSTTVVTDSAVTAPVVTDTAAVIAPAITDSASAATDSAK